MWEIVVVFLETIVLSALIYIIPENIRKRGRNDHTVILLRTVIVFSFVLFILFLHKWLLGFQTISYSEIWGLHSPYLLLPVISSMIHICILFSGTIAECFLCSKIYKDSFFFTLLNCCNYVNDAIIDLRNLCVAPLLEEFLYRGGILVFLLHSGYGIHQSIWISSIAFGSCHFHHIYDMMQSGYPLKSAILRCMFMFAYTTLFGALVSWVYVRCGNILSASAVHALCNFFSIPSFSFMEPTSSLYPYRYWLLAIYGVGIILYIALFTTMLNPQLFKSPFLSLFYNFSVYSK